MRHIKLLLKHKLNSAKNKTFFILFFVVFSLGFAITANASLYAPGATLEPDCPPTESLTTCGVNTGAVSGGGTGILSYAVGDILYASASGVLSKLAIGTAGQVLKVSGSLPVWSTGTSANIGDTDLTLTGTRILSLDGNTLTLDGSGDGSIVFNNDGSISLGGTLPLTLTGNSIASADTGLTIKANNGSTGTIQIGTGGSGTATPDIFALDVKSTSGDPAGFNGAMYFNADAGDFRCYEEGTWQDCIFHSTDSAENLTLARIGNSTFSTLQEMQNVFHSAGYTSGGVITDAGGETINVSAGTGLIRTSNDAVSGQVNYFDWVAMNGISIPTNTVRYVGVEYNGGSPQVTVRSSANWNLKTDFPIGVVVNESGNLTIYTDYQRVGDHAANMIQREYETMPLSPDVRGGGLVLGETGTRKVTVSSGAVWDRLNRYEVPTINTNVSGSFDAYYMDGSNGFTKVSNLTQWPNTKYDDQSGTLATMTDGKYATLWFYIDTNARVSMVYGMGEYATSALADSEMAPEVSMLPNKLRVFGKLLGKIVFQKSASTATEVTSLISMTGSASAAVTNHANLTGLDYASSGHTGFADAIAGVNSNITSATGLTSVTPGAALTITAGGASVWSTSAGALTIDSASALNIGTTNATSVSIGKLGITTTNNGNLSLAGSFATPKIANITTTGVINNFSVSDGVYFRYIGSDTATFTGGSGGTDGRIVTMVNASSYNVFFENEDVRSSASNRFVSGTGEEFILPPNAVASFIYDADSSRWRLYAMPSSILSVAPYAYVKTGNAFGSTASLGTTDAYGLNFITSGATRFSLATGSATLTGTGATTITTDDTLTLSSASAKALNITSGTTGVLTLDSGTTGSMNLGTGAFAKTITIGNATGVTAVNINSGSGGSTFTTTNGAFNLNTGTGAINLGTDAVAKSLTIGNTTGATSVNINAGSGGGIFKSSSGLTFNPFSTSAGNTTEIRFAELAANGANYVGFKSPDLLGANVIWTLPDADGTVGQVLTTDGSKNLSWASAGACPTCVVNTSKFTVDTNGNITKLNNITTSFPSSQGGSGTVLTNDGSGGLTWSSVGSGSAALDAVSAATTNATIGNGNNTINWNWNLSSTTNGFNISETSASSGTGYLERISTLATSTAKPFSLGARGTTIFDTTATGGITLGDSTTLNTPITLQSGTGAINIGADSVAHTLTFGNTTGSTTLNLNSGSGGINFGGNTIISGSNTFTTGTGLTTINSTSVTLAGNSTVLDMTGTGTLGLNTTTNRAITTGSGLLTVGGALTISGTTTTNGSLIVAGDFNTPKGTDYTTTGTQNNVSLGSGSLFRYSGSGVATFTGFTGGSDGKFIRIINISSSSITFNNQDTNSDAANRIITTSGGNITVSTNGSMGLQYDSTASRWRVVSVPANAASISGFAYLQNGNAFGADATLGTTDANALNFITSGSTRFTVAAASNTLTGNGASTITTSGGSLTLDATTALNLGTSTATSVSIGKTGITTTNNGAFTSTQTLTASNGFTLTTGALNLTATSGILDIGSATLAGASPLVFEGATADAFETTFAITDPTADRTITFPDASITVNAAGNISGTTLASNVVTSSLTTVGALTSGSIGSGFGSISISNNITTSANISSTGSGTITSAGALTASNGFTLTTGAFNVSATSGTIGVGSATFSGGSPLVFDGATADTNKTTFVITDPTGARTITFPNNTITINAAADISGTTLASNVVTSSLTTVGTLSAGAITTGFTSINGTPIGASSANTGKFTTLTSTGTTDLGNAGASNVTIATTGTGLVSIGNSTGTFALTSNGGLNVSTTGALTGVASIDTITASATGLTFAGAGTISTTTSSALALDSGTTGAINIGTGANAKTITIGNATGATAVNINTGTGNAIFTIGPTSSSGKVQIGNSASTTPDLLVLDNGTADPTGVTGGMYYNTGTNKFKCYENGAWANCITATSGATPNNIKTSSVSGAPIVAASQTNAAVTSVAITTSTNEVWAVVSAEFDKSSATAGDDSLYIYRDGSACGTGGTQLGNTYLGSSKGSNADKYEISFNVVEPSALTAGSHTYRLCAGTSANSTVVKANITVMEVILGADLAELYGTNDADISIGDLVSLDSTLPEGVRKSNGIYDSKLFGVVSSMPSLLMGGGQKSVVNAVPVALAGRIPVKVNNENGPIQIGDYLTSSSTPGVAMKADIFEGGVIGKALSDFDGEGIGVVTMFVDNVNLSGIGQKTVLLGDISPKVNADGTDNGLTKLVETIQNEDVRDAGLIIGKKISDGKDFLTDFVSARVTAIRGYFDEIFTKKIHTEQICVKKSDGSEVCVNGDQLDSIVGNNKTIVNTTPDSVSTDSNTPTNDTSSSSVGDSTSELEVVEEPESEVTSPAPLPEPIPEHGQTPI